MSRIIPLFLILLLALSFSSAPRGEAYAQGWVERGPINIPGPLSTVAADHRDPTWRSWWVGSPGAGLWRTTDAGGSFIPMAQGLPNLQVSALASVPENSAVLYLGTGYQGIRNDRCFHHNDAGPAGRGLFKSTDGGWTWTHLVQSDSMRYITNIITDASGQRVAVGTRMGVWRSEDGGNTWHLHAWPKAGPVIFPTFCATRLVAHPENFDVQFAVLESSDRLTTDHRTRWRSADGGATWSPILPDQPPPEEVWMKEGIAISRTHPHIVWLALHQRIWRSEDAGATWHAVPWVDPPLYSSLAPFQVHPFHPDSLIDNATYLAYRDSALHLAYPGFGTSSSASVGSITLPIDSAANHFTVLEPREYSLGILRTWGRRRTSFWNPNAFRNTPFQDVCKRAGYDAYLAISRPPPSYTSGVIASVNTQQAHYPWTDLTAAKGGSYRSVICHETDHRKALVTHSTQFNSRPHLRLTQDGGASWTGLPAPWEDAPSYYHYVAQHPGGRIFVANADKIWRSDDFGQSWERKGTDAMRWIRSIRVSPADPDVVWADLDWVSQDGGDSWTTAATPSRTRAPESILALDPQVAGRAIIIRTDPPSGLPDRPENLHIRYVHQSSDYGASWTSGAQWPQMVTGGPVRVGRVHDLFVFPQNTAMWWLGAEHGLLETKDAGLTWRRILEIPAIPITRIHYRDEQVVIATHGRGAWTINVQDVHTATSRELPDSEAALTSYPNPFAHAATLRFSIRAPAEVRLTVYDLLGRRVAVPAAGRYHAGVHQVPWRPRGLAAGIYWARLEADGRLLGKHRLVLTR